MSSANRTRRTEMTGLSRFFRRADPAPPPFASAADTVPQPPPEQPTEVLAIDSSPPRPVRSARPLPDNVVDAEPLREARRKRSRKAAERVPAAPRADNPPTAGEPPARARPEPRTRAESRAEPRPEPRPEPRTKAKVVEVQPIPLEPRRVPIDRPGEESFAPTLLLGAGGQMLGELLRQSGHLDAGQVAAILEYQRENRARFGEAAVALGFVKGPDVLWALSRQFGYDYTPAATSEDAAAFSDDLVVAKYPFSRAAETVRDLRTELLTGVLSAEISPRCALAVVSLDGGDGKTWLAANLAVSLSQLGAKTLLVDANLRSPRLHQVFGLDFLRSGLSGILSRHQRAEVLRPTRALPNLYLLPAGAVPPNPLEILQGRRFAELLYKLRRKFTHVIVDTPPASAGADARLVAARCGASVLVARRHRSSLPALNELARLLGKGNAQFAGLVVNDI